MRHCHRSKTTVGCFALISCSLVSVVTGFAETPSSSARVLSFPDDQQVGVPEFFAQSEFKLPDAEATSRKAANGQLEIPTGCFLSFALLTMGIVLGGKWLSGSRTAAFSFALCLVSSVSHPGLIQAQEPSARLTWAALPDLPNSLGVAGPFVGVQGDVLLVAGGANFPEPVWENDKVWHSEVFALRKQSAGYEWQVAGLLDRSIAYGANVSVPEGVICIGGNDSNSVLDSCFVLSWNSSTEQIETRDLPSLPRPLAYGQACVVGDSVYVAGGQTTAALDSATQSLWSLKLSALHAAAEEWKVHPAWPGPPRAFNMTVCQNNGFDDCLYLISGRFQDGERVQFLSDCWEYNPLKEAWRERAPLPQAMAAGTAIAYGQSHIFVLSGDSGSLYSRTDELRDAHPGFPKKTLAYHTITDSWSDMGSSPVNQVTTSAVQFEGAIVLPTGEVRPRVRTSKVWRISVLPKAGAFGFVDYGVLSLYLTSLVAIGIYFWWRTKATDDSDSRLSVYENRNPKLRRGWTLR